MFALTNRSELNRNFDGRRESSKLASSVGDDERSASRWVFEKKIKFDHLTYAKTALLTGSQCNKYWLVPSTINNINTKRRDSVLSSERLENSFLLGERKRKKERERKKRET